MVKEGELTAKQEAFCTFYTMLGSDTYNNAMQSALKAGYSAVTADQACQSILGKDRVKEEIALRQGLNTAKSLNTVEAIRAKHIEFMEEARAKGDLALARLNLQDLGRTYAAYSDKHVVDNSFNIELVRYAKEIDSSATTVPAIDAVTAPVGLVSGKVASTPANAGSSPEQAQNGAE